MAENEVSDEVIQSDISQVSMAAMKPLMTQREFMYIDLDLLYDFRLTALMAFIHGKEEYEYLYSHLQQYLETPTLEICKFFPKMNVKESDLDDFINNPVQGFLRSAGGSHQLHEGPARHNQVCQH